MRFFTAFLHASLGLGFGVLIVGCSSNLPHNNGRIWGCRLSVSRDDMEIAGVEVHECANPDVDPKDVGNKCEDDCKNSFCQIGFDIAEDLELTFHLCDADCKNVSEPRVTSSTCNDTNSTTQVTQALGRASVAIS